MKKTAFSAILVLLLFSLSSLLVAEGQAPEPPNVATLGPPVICSAGDSATNVKISSPQNKSYLDNPIRLNFSVTHVGMFGQFGNVGYSLDGGIIRSVSDFINKTVEFEGPDRYYKRTTVFASVSLPTLAEGVHSATVYFGAQYLGTNNPDLERYEVWAYETVDFAIGKATIFPPKIVVISPENNLTTEANSIPLILNVSAPMAAIAMQSQLRYVYAEADWLSEKQYLYFQNLSNNEHFQTMQLNTTLSNVPIGTHTLLIVVGGSVTIKQAMFVEEFDSENYSAIIFSVVFTAQQPIQTMIMSIVGLVSMFVVGLGLLVYFKKRHRDKSQ